MGLELLLYNFLFYLNGWVGVIICQKNKINNSHTKMNYASLEKLTQKTNCSKYIYIFSFVEKITKYTLGMGGQPFLVSSNKLRTLLCLSNKKLSNFLKLD